MFVSLMSCFHSLCSNERERKSTFSSHELTAILCICMQIHPDVAYVLNNMAALLDDLDSFEPAQRMYEQALEILMTLYGENHPQVREQIHVVTFSSFSSSPFPPHPYSEQTFSQVAITLENLASLLEDTGMWQEAKVNSKEL